MTAQQPLSENPWGPPAPKPITRDDQILAAAQAIHIAACIAGTEVRTWASLLPFVRDQYLGDAYAALEAAYPTITSAMELDTLPVGTLIVSDSGTVYRRALVGGLNRVNGHEVGTLEVWEQPGERETGRKIRRQRSNDLVLSGPWTVVWTRVAA